MSSIEIEDRLGITFCNRQAIAIERGEGCVVWDEDGKEYLDFTSGWGGYVLGAFTSADNGSDRQAGAENNSESEFWFHVFAFTCKIIGDS